MPTDNSGRYHSDLTDWSLDGTRTHIEYLEAVRAEHILIEAGNDEEEAALPQPRIPQQRFVIKNRAHALETELTLFEGGWMSVRQRQRNTPGEAQLLNLRYLDPEPNVTRHIAKRSLYLTVALGIGGCTAAVLAFNDVFPVLTASMGVGLLFASAIAFAVCAYRTQKRVTFATINGRAPVLKLLGTLGSFRALRDIQPHVSRAISDARTEKGTHADQLRAEMREHYRLRESNIIDQSTCKESTQRILRQF